MLFKKGIKKNGIKVIGFRKSVNKIALIKLAEKELNENGKVLMSCSVFGGLVLIIILL